MFLKLLALSLAIFSTAELGTATTFSSRWLPEPFENLEVAPNGCPVDWSIHLLLAHESECSNFYQCSNGARYLMNCAPGTAFDFNRQICDFPYNVDCTYLPSYYEESENNSSENEVDSNEDDDVAEEHTTVRDFITAQTMIPIFVTTESPESDSVEESTTLGYITAQTMRPIVNPNPPTRPPRPTTEASNIVSSESESAEESTTLGYITAQTMIPILNPNLPSTRPPRPPRPTPRPPRPTTEASNIVESVPLEPAQPVRPPRPPKPIPSTPIGGGSISIVEKCKNCTLTTEYYAYECDCKYFFRCHEGLAVLDVCPLGLLFNAERGICDYPRNVQCSSVSDSSSSEDTEESDDTSAAVESEEVNDISEEGTNNTEEDSVEAEVPTVDASEEINNGTEEVILPPVPEDENESENAASEEDVSDNGGNEIVVDDDQHSNTTNEIDSVEDATSNDVSGDGVSEVDSDAETQVICPAGYFGNVPHPTDCTSFFFCSGGVEIQLYCTTGQMFDVDSNTCVQTRGDGLCNL